ncbi:hypothetical protein SD70_29595 [Gordoniibacillus kamchatkensis]|uniref:Uncharacterized protein n=1 Tax=Gordoniibacillus kamchatkensis TaxID=1590651 RepID=A0ABR5AA60_9BACL|nr:hypothetical protein [Paenibacillus sp. VKM B-2647]KIL37946.1 hypothetical protein SD70_29595 [Paenibacillus sp. VKM B-2647]
MFEAIKDVIKETSQKLSEVAGNRCQKCPAFWEQVDYWGEDDAGCTLHRDHLEFCPLSLLPQAIMKPYVKFKERQEERYWEKLYEQELEKEREEHFLDGQV